jgi:hypothetical protein
MMELPPDRGCGPGGCAWRLFAGAAFTRVLEGVIIGLSGLPAGAGRRYLSDLIG